MDMEPSWRGHRHRGPPTQGIKIFRNTTALPRQPDCFGVLREYPAGVVRTMIASVMAVSERSVVVDEPIQVLMIEDDEKLARLTARYLENHGLAVVRSEDGESGIGIFIRGTFDVVLLDIMLPGIGGMRGVCREIRTRSDVPVLMLTARGEEADRVMGLEIGADDYIGKPFSSRELLALSAPRCGGRGASWARERRRWRRDHCDWTWPPSA